jgi:L-iditol 2-dehydrogenase
MRVARYLGGGEVAIVSEPIPACPHGGLLVRAEACGLCSGELMDWYMDRKIPHALGHEVVGIISESQDERFPVGSRVFAHHHAPCMHCEHCRRGDHVHCEQWRRTKLTPGGMAEYFAVAPENLSDTWRIDGMRPRDAALIEPLACVVKSIRTGGWKAGQPAAVIGLGVMGLMHLFLLGEDAIGYDVNSARIDWAARQGFEARTPAGWELTDVVFVCPGSQAAFEFAMQMTRTAGTIVMFAPLPPGEPLRVPQEAYFNDLRIAQSYSCGPNDTREAIRLIEKLGVWAEQVVSDFVSLEDLPNAYREMKAGRILKAMVEF